MAGLGPFISGSNHVHRRAPHQWAVLATLMTCGLACGNARAVTGADLDSGTAFDGGLNDGGSRPDSGSASDGGILDAGELVDGGRTDAGVGPSTDGGSPSDAGLTPLAGVWALAGSDGFGAYTGQIELTVDGGGYDVTRVVQYTSATVEDGGILWWVWQGEAGEVGGQVSLTVPLQVADFISARGSLIRTAADMAPVVITGQFSEVPGSVSGTFSGAGSGVTVAASETWTDWTPAGPQPIFQTQVALKQLNSPLGANEKNAYFTTYASFFALPTVAPYVNDPLFQAAVHYAIIDQTDYGFYQANPGALRVVDKIVDPISTQETLARADAYRWTLVDKAGFVDGEMPTAFVDPLTGMLGDTATAAGPLPSGDGDLWTATYIASQAFRYQLTGDAAALANIASSLAGLLTCIEITGDATQFARTLRPTTGTAAASAGSSSSSIWVQGTGPFAALDWLSGGNNDMFKGLIYGSLTAYETLCDPVLTGQQALCSRIQTDVASIADNLAVAQAKGSGDRFLAQWLAAYVVGGLTYTLGVNEEWAVEIKQLQNADFQEEEVVTADWSGTHLTFVEFVCTYLLSQKVPLSDDTHSLALGVDTMKGNFAPFRMGAWSVLFATLGTAGADPASADDARWRLRELSVPKPTCAIDHRINAGFVMSPFPNVPWKSDWTTTDRTQSLFGYPLFEEEVDNYAWKDSPLAYLGDSLAGPSVEADFLHAYWLGRLLGVFSATE